MKQTHVIARNNNGIFWSYLFLTSLCRTNPRLKYTFVALYIPKAILGEQVTSLKGKSQTVSSGRNWEWMSPSPDKIATRQEGSF